MIKIITKSVISVFALFAVVGAANATVVTAGTYQAGSLPANGYPNISSDNGSFEYTLSNNGKASMSYDASGTFQLNGGPGGLITDGKIKVTGTVGKDGKLNGGGTISGTWDGTYYKDLVTFNSNDEFSFAWDTLAGDMDIFGMSITNIQCAAWDFCTNTETFYAVGEFGSNPDKIKVKNGVLGVTTIPVPAAVWLFGSGLLGLVGVARKQPA